MKPWRTETTLPDGRILVTIQDPREIEGELLWAERYPEEEVIKSEINLGADAEAQLQQNPVSALGGIFKSDWIKYWSPGGKIDGTVPLPGSAGKKLISWDCSFKGKDTSDPSCGGAWMRSKGGFYLTDVEWDRWSFTELVAAVRRLCDRNPRIIHKLVESKANGPAVVDTLKDLYPGFEEIEPEGGKEARAHAVTPLFKAGVVYLPHPSLFPWVPRAVNELLRFPRGGTDDFVDMTTQALVVLYLGGPKLSEMMAALKATPGTRRSLVGGR